MPPRRKQRPSTLGHPFKLRLPDDVTDQIRTKALETGWPLNKCIVSQLAEYPTLKTIGTLDDVAQHFEVMLARYAALITVHDLQRDLRAAAAAAVKTEGGAQKAALDRLRGVLDLIAKHEREAEEADK